MLLETYRTLRVVTKQLLGAEPVVLVDSQIPLEFHGNGYCGWCVPRDFLESESVVVDIGLGEDVSFSQSLIAKYRCIVHGFDPTPRAVQYVKALGEPNLILHEFAVASRSGKAVFYLPNDATHVSGSLSKAAHVGARELHVDLVTFPDVFDLVGKQNIDVLKIDVEGAEYELIADSSFEQYAPRIRCLCVEFHHRWPNFGKLATVAAVERLRKLGFRCVWRARTTNEEFTFVNDRLA